MTNIIGSGGHGSGGSRRSRRCRGGLTLLECMVALVVLSVMLVAVLATTVAGQQHLNASEHALCATRAARDLLEEIASMAYEDPGQAVVFGAEPDESGRQTWDDMDDFDGYAEEPGQVRDARGVLYPEDVQACRRTVAVSVHTQTLPQIGTVTGKRVTVTVSHTGGGEWTHTRFIVRPVE